MVKRDFFKNPINTKESKEVHVTHDLSEGPPASSCQQGRLDAMKDPKEQTINRC